MSAADIQKGLTLSALAMLAFCICDTVIKYYLTDYTVFQTMSLGFLGAALLSFLHLISQKARPLAVSNWQTVGVFSVLYLFENLTFFMALKYMDFSVVFVFVMAIPIVAAKLAQIVLGESLSLRQHAALLVAFLGVMVIVLVPHHGDQSLLELTFWGVAFAVLNIISCASKMVYLRKNGATEDSNIMNFWSLFIIGLVATCLALWEGTPLPLAHDLSWIILFPIIGMIGNLLYVQSYKLAPATVLAPVMFSQLIWATLIGVFFFNESLTIAFVVGALVLCVAGLLFYWPRKKDSTL